MGIDFLDCCIRIEKEFQLDRWDLDRDKLDVPRTRGGTLIGVTTAIARWVEICMLAKAKQPPPDLWPRIQACIAAKVSVPPDKVALTSRIIEDLGFR